MQQASDNMGVQVTDFLGSAAFSQAVQALDIKTGMLVCLKIIKVRSSKLANLLSKYFSHYCIGVREVMLHGMLFAASVKRFREHAMQQFADCRTTRTTSIRAWTRSSCSSM